MRVDGSIVGIGLLNKDHIAVVPVWQRDEKTAAATYLEQVGGPVPVALMMLAMLGTSIRPQLFSVVGGDCEGGQLLRWLAEDGVDAARVQRAASESVLTSKSFAVVDSHDGTRTLVNAGADALPPLELTAAHREILSWTRLLHLDGREPVIALEAAKTVKAAGGTVSLDLGTARPGTEELIACCDIVLASKKGGAGMFPAIAKYPARQVYGFLGMGARIAGVTLGRRGMVLGVRYGKDVIVHVLPAYRVPDVVDTCGAGDVFHGAFLWAHLAGKEPMECARFAQAAAALRIQHLGNRAGLPTRHDIDLFLALEHSAQAA